MKGYTVFNAEQCDGLPAHYTTKAEPPASPRPLSRLHRRNDLPSSPSSSAVSRAGISPSSFVSPGRFASRMRT
jgi:antirestriction protein ArdC